MKLRNIFYTTICALFIMGAMISCNDDDDEEDVYEETTTSTNITNKSYLNQDND